MDGVKVLCPCSMTIPGNLDLSCTIYWILESINMLKLQKDEKKHKTSQCKFLKGKPITIALTIFEETLQMLCK